MFMSVFLILSIFKQKFNILVGYKLFILWDKKLISKGFDQFFLSKLKKLTMLTTPWYSNYRSFKTLNWDACKENFKELYTCIFSELHKGVSQGVILGYVIFDIFSNDISHIVSDCDLLKYADDNIPSVSINDINSLKKNFRIKHLNPC